MDYLSRLLAEGIPLGLRVLIGSEMKAAQGLRIGVHGLVPVSANFEPDTFIAAYAARDDAERLAMLQERIATIVKKVVLGPRSWVAGVKYAVAARGTGSPNPVSPTEPLNATEREQIDRFLQQNAPQQPTRIR